MPECIPSPGRSAGGFSDGYFSARRMPCVTSFLFFTGLFLTATVSVLAQSQNSSVKLRYHFVPGQTLHYLIQRDPYFADPAGAMETMDPDAPYRPPYVERLTEDVLAVERDGEATLKITLEPEPGFEEESQASPTVQTLTVTPLGQILSPSRLAPASDFLKVFFRLPTTPVERGLRGTAWIAQTQPMTVTESRSRGQDGLLQQTTRCVESDSLIFDLEAGNLRHQSSQLTATLSLVMLERGRRGSADFGRVIPNVRVVQTMTIERRDDLPTLTATHPAPNDGSGTGGAKLGTPGTFSGRTYSRSPQTM
jgi:hypothetical protein